MLLEAREITKRYGTRVVLDGVTFSIRRQEILGLIGPNGAGKTTLFEFLSRLIPMDAGACPGEPLFYMPDGIRPWADRTVMRVAEFFSEIYGRGSRLAEWLIALDLQPLASARIASLSKGESRRALVLFALLTPHPLLLLDEPFDGLDFRQTREVMALLRTQPAEGRTLFLSIHQLTDAARICDRLILLSQGRVAGEGTMDELRSVAGLPQGSLEEVFLAFT